MYACPYVLDEKNTLFLSGDKKSDDEKLHYCGTVVCIDIVQISVIETKKKRLQPF